MTDKYRGAGRATAPGLATACAVLLAAGCASSQPPLPAVAHTSALTAAAAAARSLRQLHRYQQRLDAANEPVEEAVTVIRSQLGLPPPDTS